MDTQSKVVTVDDQNFAEEVLQSQLPVLVDFTAEWCPPCRALAPVLDRMSVEYEGKLRFARLDVDENPAVTGVYGVRAMPTMVMFTDGQEQGRIVGFNPPRLKPEIERLLSQKTSLTW